MWQIVVHFLKEKLTVKQRSAVAVIGLSGIILLSMAWNWDEMVYNITHHRMPHTPAYINIEECLKKGNFIQVGDYVEETLKAEVEINEVCKGVTNREDDYYANVTICNEDTGLRIEIDITPEEYEIIKPYEHHYLVRKRYYNNKGYEEYTVDTLYKNAEEYRKTLKVEED